MVSDKEGSGLPTFNPEDRILDQATHQSLIDTSGVTAGEAFKAGLSNTVAASAMRALARNPSNPIAAFTGTGGTWGDNPHAWKEGADWDKTYAGLTDGIPLEYHDELFTQDTEAGAWRIREDIKTEMKNNEVLSKAGGGAAFAGMLGSFVDLDLPASIAATALSGGSFAALKGAGMAKRALATAKLAGVSAAGGATLGVAEATLSPTKDWKDGVHAALTYGAMGGALSGFGAGISAISKTRRQFEQAVADGADEVFNELPVIGKGVPRSSTVQLRPADDVAGDQVDNAEFDVISYVPPSGRGLSAQSGPTQQAFPNLKDPTGQMPASAKTWIPEAQRRVFHEDFEFQKTVIEESVIGRAGTHWFANIGTNNVMGLLKTKSSVANWLLLDVFDMPGGQIRGRTDNAANLKGMYEKRLAEKVHAARNMANEWAESTGNAGRSFSTGWRTGIKADAVPQYRREVIMDMNNASLGRPRTASPEVQRASDAYFEIGYEQHRIMKGMANEHMLEGAERIADGALYLPYRNNGIKMTAHIMSGAYTKADLVRAISTAYQNAGTFTASDMADTVAEAYVQRMLSKASKIDDNMISVFSQDGREYLREALSQQGMSMSDIDSFMKRFDGEAEERSKLGQLKHRNELDFDTQIGNSNFKIVDLMEEDLDLVFEMQNRSIAGQSALARVGITSRAKQKEVVDVLLAEQRALGEMPLDGELLTAMMDSFNGPELGYFKGMGTNKGLGVLSDLKNLTMLAALPLNVFAQMAETGAVLVAGGLATSMKHGVHRHVDEMLRTADKENLNALAAVLGGIGTDADALRHYTSFDDAVEYTHGNAAVEKAMRSVRNGINKASQIQGVVTGLVKVRKEQQTFALSVMMNKVLLELKNNGPHSGMFNTGTGRMWRDYGIDVDLADEILSNMTAHGTWGRSTTKLGDLEYADRTNLGMWDGRVAQKFAAGLHRGLYQAVQAPLQGETDRWMHTMMGSMLSQLQTFPLLAVQKQFFRHAQSADRDTALSALAGVSTAYVAMYMRDTLTGTERSAEDRAKLAFSYSNVTGWVSMYSDPIMSSLGLQNARFNTFNPTSSPLNIPSVDIFKNMWNAPGAALHKIGVLDEPDTKVITGTATDNSALRAVPGLRLLELAANMAQVDRLYSDQK